MDEYRQLAERLRLIGGERQTPILQGIVRGVDGLTCSVEIGSLTMDGVRLRASEAENENHILVKPRLNTPVLVGSLSGDLRDLAVLAVDEVEEVEVHATKITLNDGQNGGLINIDVLTRQVNELVQAFNAHTHVVNTTGSATAQSGTASPVTAQARELNRKDYEDTSIRH